MGPRFFSEQAPNAVATIWDDIEPWLVQQGITLRPWQEQVARRALEVDADGTLCWRTVAVSTPRQSGKSWLLKALALGRAAHPDLFGGEPQTVAHVANRHTAARRIHTQAWGWAGRQGLVVRTAIGGERIIFPDGSCWNVNTLTNIYGESASCLFLDECWNVSPEDYREGLRPTQVARRMPQFWALSTAHRRASPLMTELMAQGQTGAGRTLLADWGAAPGADPMDPATWEAASPYWDAQRRDEMELVAGTAGFAEQWINVWGSQGDEGDGRWLPRRATDMSRGPVGNAPQSAICGIEVTQDGRRVAVAAAWPHRRQQVRARVWYCDSLREALLIAGSRRIYAHQAVLNAPEMKTHAVTPITVAISRAATTELRESLLNGHLTVAGVSDDDWEAIKTTPADGGEIISAPRSTGPVCGPKALSWAVWAVASERSHTGLVL